MRSSAQQMEQRVLQAGANKAPCEDGGIKIWSISGQLLHTVRAQANRSTGVCSLAWITNPPDTSPVHVGWLAIGNGDSTIVVIDLEALLTDDAAVAAVAPVCTLTKHTGAVHALLWIPERGWLVSGASDHTIRTWRIGSGAGPPCVRAPATTASAAAAPATAAAGGLHARAPRGGPNSPPRSRMSVQCP